MNRRITNLPKSVNYLIYIFLLVQFSSCSNLNYESTSNVKVLEHLNKTNSPKIGYEFETSNMVFFYDQNEKANFFNKRDVIAKNEEKKFELQTDFVPNSKKRFSVLECVTSPFNFISPENEEMLESIEAIENLLLDLEFDMKRDTYPDHKNNFFTQSLDDNLSLENDFGVLNKINSFKKEDIIKHARKIGDNTSNIGFIIKDQSYIFPSKTTSICPQVTLPLPFRAINRFYNHLILRNPSQSDIFTKLQFFGSQKYTMNKFQSKLYNTYHGGSFKKLLKDKNLDINNSDLKGFLYIICDYINSFHNKGSRSSLKNGLPILNLRNSFTTFFELLPEEISMKLRKNNAKLFLKLVKHLMTNGHTVLTFFSLNEPLFKKEIPAISRHIMPHLKISTWLQEMAKGNDLLDKSSHVQFFKDITVDERDLEEVSNVFNYFTDHTEKIGGKDCAIFEIRIRPQYRLKKGVLVNYVKEYTKYLYEITHLEY